jgi:hypothetical protein
MKFKINVALWAVLLAMTVLFLGGCKHTAQRDTGNPAGGGGHGGHSHYTDAE